MKKILLLLLITTSTFFAQTSKIKYKVVLHNPKNSSKPLALDNISNAQYLKFNLLFNEVSSSFDVEYQGIFNESLVRKEKKVKITEILVGYIGEYYQDVKLNSKMVHFIDYNIYQIDNDYKMKDWIVTGDKKNILGHECIKAIKKEFNKRSEKYIDVVAWFSPELKGVYGPVGYGGLKGVILELHRGKRYSYYVESIELLKLIDEPKTIPEAEEISVEESVRLMRLARRNK